MLTKKQLELFIFINKTIKVAGISPSYDEMRKALNLKSKSGIHRLISGLEERGFIKRLPHRARALEILKSPDISTSENRIHNQIMNFGTIAAGTPVEAIENPEGYLSVPSNMIKNNSSYYALKISGESMVEAGILDDDIAVKEKTTDVKNGDIVVA